MTIRHIAEVTDPITGDTTILTASTAPELDQLVEDHLEQHYPNTQHEDPASAGMGCQLWSRHIRRGRGDVRGREVTKLL